MNTLERFIQNNFLDSDSLSLINKCVRQGYKSRFMSECVKEYWVEFTTPELNKYRIEVVYPEYSANFLPFIVKILEIYYISRPVSNDGHTYMSKAKRFRQVHEFRACEVSPCTDAIRQIIGSQLYPF